MIPSITPQADLSIRILARPLALPEQLLRAIVLVESGCDAYAWNPEPAYRYLWDVVHQLPFRALTDAERASEVPPKDFPYLVGARDAEWWGQQASWGPMQVMGGVARELGLTGHFPALCDIHLGIDFGARYLTSLRKRFQSTYGWRGVVAAYNAGSPRFAGDVFVNQAYVDKVKGAGGFEGLDS
jgi:hypothetical protein